MDTSVKLSEFLVQYTKTEIFYFSGIIFFVLGLMLANIVSFKGILLFGLLYVVYKYYIKDKK